MPAIYQGDKKIVDRYVGETLVTRTYQGDKLIFDAYSELSDTLPLAVRSRASQVLKNYRIYGAAGSTNILPPQTDTSVWDTVGYIRTDGGIRVDQNYRTTTFLDAAEGTLSFTNTSPDSSWYRFAWYDENQVWLSETSGYSDTVTVTPPVSAAYMRISINTASDVSFVTDGTPTPENPVEVTGLGERTENLYDAVNIGEGYIRSRALDANGNAYMPSGASYYSVSYYIPVLSERIYTLVMNATSQMADMSMCFYDYAKNFVSGLAYGTPFSNKTFTTPPDCVYMRFTVRNVVVNSIMVVEGSTAPTSYIPYGYKLPLVVRNRNLFDGNYTHAYIDTVHYDYQTANNTRTAVVKVEPNTTYIVKKFDTSNRFYIAEAPEYPQFGRVYHALNTINKSAETITTGNDTNYILVYVSNDNFEPRLTVTKGLTEPDLFIPYFHDEENIYIGDSQLMEGEYVDYEEQKIYKLIDGVLTPTDPPVPFPDITLPQGEVTIDIEGSLKPQATVKGRINPTA